jgi:hypothetical protein
MQVRTNLHMKRSMELKEEFERNKLILGEDGKRFFKLFTESTEDKSQAAARKMKKIAKRQTKHNQRLMLFHSLQFLLRSDLKMLSWLNSPLLVMLQFVDPNVLLGDEETRFTPLHDLADLADPFDYSTHKNQVILAKQLIKHGANVNAVTSPDGKTPLQKACYSGNVTNLDFLKLLLKEGANPNSKDYLGQTPLMFSVPLAPDAAKFLLNWPTTDANITNRSGESFLVNVRSTIDLFSDRQLLVQPWRDIEVLLVERGVTATEITAHLQDIPMHHAPSI